MKCLEDPDKILKDFSKYLLIFDSDMDTAMGLVLRDIMYDMGIKKVDMTNRVKLTAMFQDVFDIVNPHAGNIFSAFDVDFNLDEDIPNFSIRFMNDFFEIQEDVYRDTVVIEFNK